MPADREEGDERSAEGSTKTEGACPLFIEGFSIVNEIQKPLSVPADPSADSSPSSSLRAGTSKLFFIKKLINRSGQAVNWEGSTPYYDLNSLITTLNPVH